MTLPFTPDMLRAAYDFLNETPPFIRWNLPDSDDMQFRVAEDTAHHGWLLSGRRKIPVIAVSRSTIGHTYNLLVTVAHEMVHLHQHRAKLPLTHGAGWKRLVAQVCRYHGFDPKMF